MLALDILKALETIAQFSLGPSPLSNISILNGLLTAKPEDAAEPGQQGGRLALPPAAPYAHALVYSSHVPGLPSCQCYNYASIAAGSVWLWGPSGLLRTLQLLLQLIRTQPAFCWSLENCCNSHPSHEQASCCRGGRQEGGPLCTPQCAGPDLGEARSLCQGPVLK